MKIQFRYIVLFCQNIEASKRFYEALGLVFQKEQHGKGDKKGPVHFSTDVSGVVLELYPAQNGVVGRERIGFAVPNVINIATALKDAGGKLISTSSSGSPSVRAKFEDPDGRTIEINQE